MLAADRQLLDAHLRNELQQLRRLEITNVVNRFQSCLTPATLIAGFSMIGISALDFTSFFHLDQNSRIAEPVFYLCTAVALATSLYVTAVGSMGIIFGQRLTIQATATQGHDHDKTVQELNNKFLYSLIALGCSMTAVVIAATAVIWVKDPTTVALQRGALEHPHSRNSTSVVSGGNYYTSITCTTLSIFLGACTMLSMAQMYSRLHTPAPVSADLNLRTQQGKAVGDASEFYVASEPGGSRG